MIGRCTGTTDYHITPKSTFGIGNWEKLKSLRRNNYHPIAWWHPDVSNSIVHPDGVYVGKISQLHDPYHVHRLNEMPSLTRQRLLKWDDALIAPRYACYRRISKAIIDKSPLQLQDNIFVESYSNNYALSRIY